MDQNQTTIQTSSNMYQPQATQKQPEQLDPTVVSLTRAIGRAETGGNYSDYGSDNGHSAGAYSWNNPTPMKPGDIPANFKSDAQQYGLNPEDFSPANQDKVAYTKVQALGKSGLKPAQVASLWNSGNPDSYKTQHAGYNQAQGVSYDTPAYVKRVEQYYGHEVGGHDENEPADTIRHGGLDFNPNLSENSGSKEYTGSQAAAQIAPVALGGAGLIATLLSGGTDIPLLAGGAAATETGGGGILNAIKTSAGKLVKGGTLLEAAKGLIGGGGDTTNINEDTAGEQKLQEEIQQLESSLPQDRQGQQEIQKAIAGILGTTQSGTKDLEDPRIQQGIRTMAMYGGLAPTGTDENGRISTQDNISKAEEHIGNISENLAKVHDTEKGTVNLDKVASDAKSEYRHYNPNSTPNELQQADRNIDNEIGSYKQHYGSSNIKLGESERARKQQGHAAGKWDATNTTKKGAHKSLYGALRANNYATTEHKELYERAMKEQSALQDVKKVLKKIDGKKAPTEKGFLEQAFRTLGKYGAVGVGDKLGGPFGAIIGGLVGEHLAQIVEKRFDKHFGKDIFESKGMKEAMKAVQNENPTIARVLEAKLKEFQKKEDLEKKYKEYKKHKGMIGGKKTSSYEPYQTEKKLPVIQLGKKPVKRVNLPVIQY